MSNPTTRPENPWRELWQKWFDDSGDPWCYDDSWGTRYCHFCDGEHPSHVRGCIYVTAKQLLEQENEEATNE